MHKPIDTKSTSSEVFLCLNRTYSRCENEIRFVKNKKIVFELFAMNDPGVNNLKAKLNALSSS